MITKQEIQYEGFGKCLEITNGIIRLIVTLDFGPRVIRYSFVDGENILFEDPERAFYNNNPAISEAYGEGSVWYTYGGHRLWTSPEAIPRTTYPDIDPVAYELTDKGAIFTPPVQKCNNYGMAIEVVMAEDSGEVLLQHRVTNHGLWPITLASWAITVLSSGGTEIVPQPTRNTGLLANRQIALWSYAKATDSRFSWLDRYIVLSHNPQVKDAFKMGINSQHGRALYFNHGDVFVKEFQVNDMGNYPDGGMSFESYMNGLFLEMESLGELVTLEPGQCTGHWERWYLHRGELPELSDDALDEAVKKYGR